MKENTLDFKSALISGVILGIISLLWFFIQYLFDIKPVGIVTPIIIGLISLAIFIVVPIFLIKQYRSKIGGYISFLHAAGYLFIALVAATILSGLFSFLFLHFVDPEYYVNILQAQYDWMDEFMYKQGVPDDQIENALAKIKEQIDNATLGRQTLDALKIGSIVNLVVSIIFGLIFKKKPNLFDEKAID
jgi:hypothetical protein